ncbi:H-type lectin domain-containing protein [Aliiroseovarius sp. F20344]|uniref:H-type lectin domain-containing protein n=1 Tax=Aliiroseovarius sp. F20344 TaxID=2926414 RepID=UPI001FF58183|nr:H-type lectin domain-containing protein [Aliiroseovarius sp. F20344]MCK0141780.1 H-type lectin domain-containing protein [Aliiroseovarius sp. F20344]
MRRIRPQMLGVDRGSKVLFSDFEHDGEMWTGTGPRKLRCPIKFSEPFLSPPIVTVSMSMWDIAGESNQRADVTTDNVTIEGFDIVFRTWGDTRVARVRTDWFAMGEVADDEIWDV